MTKEKVVYDVDNDSWIEEFQNVYDAAVTKEVYDKYGYYHIFTKEELMKLIESKQIVLLNENSYGLITSGKSLNIDFIHEEYNPIEFYYLDTDCYMINDDDFKERIKLLRSINITNELKEIITDLKDNIIELFKYCNSEYEYQKAITNECYKWLNNETNKEYKKLLG